MKQRLIILLCIGTMLVACDEKAMERAEKDLELDHNDRAAIGLFNHFTARMFDEIQKATDSTENILLSPYSANVVLSLVANGAEEETRDAMMNALGFRDSDIDQVNVTHQKLIEGLPFVSLKNKLSVANSVWVNQQYQIVPAFLSRAKDHYRARTTRIPFVNPDAPDAINRWVKEQTGDKIDKILDEVNDGDLMYLLNAIYFKGAWDQKFDPELTTEDQFHKADGSTVQADYMRNTGNYNVTSIRGLDAVEIPYADKKYSMIVVRNAADVTPYDVSVIDLLSHATAVSRKVSLELPKFLFGFERKLNPDLINMGMGVAFTDQADFSGIIADKPANISIVKQKTFIEVNEEGTEAAAVTGVRMEVTSVPMIETMKFDRPFLFLIKENLSNLVLFVGIVNDPSVSG